MHVAVEHTVAVDGREGTGDAAHQLGHSHTTGRQRLVLAACRATGAQRVDTVDPLAQHPGFRIHLAGRVELRRRPAAEVFECGDLTLESTFSGASRFDFEGGRTTIVQMHEIDLATGESMDRLHDSHALHGPLADLEERRRFGTKAAGVAQDATLDELLERRTPGLDD